MSENSFVYNILCFTTNENSFEPLSLLKKYATCSEYNTKKVIRYNPLDFYYKTNSRTILISINQIINLIQGKNPICCFADSYLIFLDLEDENIFDKLNEIINFMNNLCDLEKTAYILGLYSNIENIKNDLNEEDIKEFLEDKVLTYEYFEAKIQSANDFNKTMDYIIEGGLKKIENKLKNQDLVTKTDSESKSNCVIF